MFFSLLYIFHWWLPMCIIDSTCYWQVRYHSQIFIHKWFLTDRHLLTCVYVDIMMMMTMLVCCQLRASYTWFIVSCFHGDMLVSCLVMAWHAWFIVFVCFHGDMPVCCQSWHIMFRRLSCFHVDMLVSCQLVAWHTWFSGLSPCKYAGMLSAYDMALMVHCLASM